MTEPAIPPSLIFAPARRPAPPRHLADLSVQERRGAVVELGEKPFRARQLSVHYFERLVDDPSAMTDPRGIPERLQKALLRGYSTQVRRLECDGGTTVKTVWRLRLSPSWRAC
jgi:23S rRNA (adenine2503-C2)-methyltransferase